MYIPGAHSDSIIICKELVGRIIQSERADNFSELQRVKRGESASAMNKSPSPHRWTVIVITKTDKLIGLATHQAKGNLPSGATVTQTCSLSDQAIASGKELGTYSPA